MTAAALPGFDTPAVGFEQPFEMLAACHDRVRRSLVLLQRLIEHIDATGHDAQSRSAAADVLRYFDLAAPQHHLDEEEKVFPPLLVGGDAELVAAVRRLQQDHGWIEEDWLELAPQLRAIASGNSWVDPAEFQHDVEVFLDLCRGHIALEETLIYPQSKAHWAQAVALRATRGPA